MDITIERLHFSYNGKPVLQKITLNVQKGEILAIVGPNGSGKTTLLKNISGVLTPDAGVVYLDMKRVTGLSPRELSRCLTAVEQEHEVGFDFTVREVIAMGRIPYQGRFAKETTKDAQRIREAMELAHVTSFANRSIRELSGGEKQRVFLAMALAQDPRVLLLDEPTTYLDINYQLQIMKIVRQQASAGLTVLMALHDLNLAAQYADRVAILYRGRLLAIGSPVDVLTKANIKQAFHADVVVGKNSVTNSIYISTVPQRLKAPTSLGKLHIICGGGSGAAVLHALADRFSLSVGVVSPLDSDFQVAQYLGAKLVTEVPFAPISTRAYEENLAIMRSSDGVIICETPFGSGNLLNLRAAVELESKTNIYVLNPEGIKKRDYTGGQATKLIRQLVRSGAVPVNGLGALKRRLISGYYNTDCDINRQSEPSESAPKAAAGR
ncbi:MAG TPA: heme ABC transporter ATP-binding protein [Candidatus Acetothermia bacterium]|nr:heme ABC transporter ATP-binding protein [Candidatus Acetothermia bacterium]